MSLSISFYLPIFSFSDSEVTLINYLVIFVILIVLARLYRLYNHGIGQFLLRCIGLDSTGNTEFYVFLSFRVMVTAKPNRQYSSFLKNLL